MAPALVRDALKEQVDQPRQPRLRGQRHRRLQGGCRRLHAARSSASSLDPDHGNQPRHRVEAGLRHAARRVHQSRRRDPDDGARLSRGRHPHALLRRARCIRCRLRAENDFYPDLAGIPADVRKRAKLLVINYPNSPTGQTATTREFYRRVIDFAHTNQIVVVQDAAHVLLSYDGPPLSFLQVDGAREVGVEVHSMSKGFNMIGWRMGFVCRPSEDRAGVRRREGQLRFGAVHGHPAGSGHGPAPSRDRRAGAREVPSPADEAGRCPARRPASTQPCPRGRISSTPRLRRRAEGRKFSNAEEVSQFLIEQQSVCCVPWDDAGAFLRFSATYLAKDEAEEDALMAQTAERLGRLKLEF